MGASSQSVWRPGAGSGIASFGNGGRRCSLEADLDQVGSVVSSEFEGASAVDGCTRSLGGMETPEPREVARIPSENVPVCAVKGVSATACMGETPCAKESPGANETPCVGGVVASVPECVLPSAPCVKEAVCVSGTVCMNETPRVSEQPCGIEAWCV